MDRELIERFQRGDEEAFREIFEYYQNSVFRLAYHFVGNRPEAEELTQEIFLKMYLSIGQFDFRANFYTWLYRIAVNRCLQDRRKKRVERVPLREALTVTSAETPLDRLLTEATGERVQKALDRLPPKQKMVLLLKEMEGLNYQEIAEILGVFEGTVASRLHSARKEFKSAYQKEVERS